MYYSILPPATPDELPGRYWRKSFGRETLICDAENRISEVLSTDPAVFLKLHQAFPCGRIP